MTKSKRGFRALGGLCAAAAVAMAFTGLAIASGGGGGGGNAGTPLPDYTGIWSGQAVLPAPVVLETLTMTLSQDPAGNLSGTICLRLFTDSCVTGTNIGRVSSNGSFTISGNEIKFTGNVIGTMACKDGSVSTWIGGGTSAHGATGSWSATHCAP